MFSFKEYGKGPLKCVELASGEERWSQDGFGPGNCILVGSVLVALSDAGELVLVDPRPEGYAELARADVLAGKCWSTPSFSDGQLYARSTSEDVAISGNVLANDTDAEGDALTVTTAGSFTTSLGAAVTLGANGAYTYDPTVSATLQAMAAGQSKQDSFSYSISDGNGGADTATVDVTVFGFNEPGAGGGCRCLARRHRHRP